MRFGEGDAEVPDAVLDAHISECSLPRRDVYYAFGVKPMDDLFVDGAWEAPEQYGLDQIVWAGICRAAWVLAANGDAKALPVDVALLLFMQ